MPRELNPSLRFGFLIHDVAQLRRMLVDHALKPFGITRSQWWMLASLSNCDGMTQTMLADEMGLTKVAIGRLIDRMEVDGFVKRRIDAADARARRVYLAKPGAMIVRSMWESVEAIESQIQEGVSSEELGRTAESLIRIKQTLQTLVGPSDLQDDPEPNPVRE